MNRTRVWLHGASVGDARALGPLLEALTTIAAPLLTVGRRLGREAARSWYPDLTILRPPLPLRPAPDLFLARHRPQLVLLEYLELWPAWMAACERAGLPVVVVDGRVTHRSLRVRGLLRRSAARVAAFCAQTDADALAAVALGVPPERVRVTGNGKHDRQVAPPLPSEALRSAVGDVELVVGSLHPDEEAAALPALARFPGRILLAPRYPARAAALRAAALALGVPCERRSSGAAAEARWVILDTVGELAAAYGLGKVALIGGTFGRREGQNLVEAAAHGMPVVHGPRTANVAAEALALRGRGAFAEPDLARAVARAAALLAAPAEAPDPRPALATLRGAVQRQLSVIAPFLEAAAVR